MSTTASERRSAHRWSSLRWWRAVLGGYAAVALIGSLVVLLFGVAGPAFVSSNAANDPADSDFSADVADSWNRFNADTAEASPSWDGDQFLAAVGDTSVGALIRMPGAQTTLDDAAVKAAVQDSPVVVVVTPPTPLGAVETTRIRDNTVQKFWATERGLFLVMVHGQEVYQPGPDLFSVRTATSGLPLREAMRTGDVTGIVLQTVGDAKAKDFLDVAPPAGSDAVTPAALALEGRAPTAAEVAPVTAALDAGPLYVDEAVADPPRWNKAWSALAPGHDVKVVLLPFAAPDTTPVDWVGALAARYPGAAIIVMTGKWVEGAGLDAQRLVDVALQTYAVGGFALAASAPAYGEILTWVTSLYSVATKAAAAHATQPTLPESGIPRWTAYLVLATALIIAAGFAVSALIDRRRRPLISRDAWLAQVTDGLTTSYLALTAAPRLDPAVPPERIQDRLDSAYAGILQLHGSPGDAGGVARAAWDDLSEAARLLAAPDDAPGAHLPDTLRTPPKARRRAATRRRSLWPAIRRRLSGSRLLVGYGIVLVAAVPLLSVILGRFDLTTPDDAADLHGLQTSSVVVAGSTTSADVRAAQTAIGNRSLMLYVDNGLSRDGAYGTAEAAAGDYPDAVVFVVVDGEIRGARIGDGAHIEGYSDDSLIYDYYDVQEVAGGDVPALARQLALLYDRLTAEGSIAAVDRVTYDPGGGPPTWVVATGLVLATVLAAGLVLFTVRAVDRRTGASADVRARRDALALRLSETSVQLLKAGTDHPHDLPDLTRFAARRQALSDRITAAEAEELPGLEREVEELDESVGVAFG